MDLVMSFTATRLVTNKNPFFPAAKAIKKIRSVISFTLTIKCRYWFVRSDECQNPHRFPGFTLTLGQSGLVGISKPKNEQNREEYLIILTVISLLFKE